MISSRVVTLSILWFASLLVFGPRVCSADPPSVTETSTAKSAEAWSTQGWPLIAQYCLDCHNEDTQEGELDLSSFSSLKEMDGGADSMQRLLEIVRFGAMPPEDADQPTPEERKQLVNSLDQMLFAVSCDLRPRPGKVTARRLNRSEYNRSMSDLFGISLRPADAFPSDEVGAGFDNNGDVLSLSPMLMEKYLAAAEEVASQVLVDPATLPRLNAEAASEQLKVHGDSKTGSFNGRFLKAEGFAWADFEIPVEGEYRLRISGGNTERETEPTSFAVYDNAGLLRGHGELEYYGGSGGSQSFEFRDRFEKGPLRLFVVPTTDEMELVDHETVSDRIANLPDEVIQKAEEEAKKPLRPERRFYRPDYPHMVRKVSIDGPREQPTDAYPPSQHQVVRRMAREKDGRWHDVESSAIDCLQPLMRRAFREPVRQEEVKPYAQLVVTATERGESYHRGLQFAVTAILMSPRFLFRVETPPINQKPERDGVMKLTQMQLATRLSYFLWSSLPDEKLLQDAEKGRLTDKSIPHHVKRMLADPRADSMATEFAAQWFGLRNLTSHEADTDRFKSFTPSLRGAMARETELLFLHLMRDNRPVNELLQTRYSFVNQELAEHYDLTDVDWETEAGNVGEGFKRVSLEGTPRRGVLSHASILTLTSNPTRTSPVKRGKWILENVLGTPPPEPPAGVPELEETASAAADATLREQLEIHRSNPACASCHRVMDELGFGLEEFDAVGKFREFDGKSLVNARGELPGGRTFDGTSELSELLSQTEQAAFARTVTHRLMTFALGRELTPTDRCVVDEIVAKTAEKDYRLSDLVLQVVQSRPFQYYEWSASSP